MKTKKVKISDVKVNPNNPRLIKDDKFAKLVKSIQDFPQMMELRPIIIDENNVIQGGNMRFKALQHLGFKDIPDTWVKQGKDLTPEQWREFVIKDNVGFGEWDFEQLTNEWDTEQLSDWGLDVPQWVAGMDENNMTDEDVDLGEEFDPIGSASDLMKIVFIFDNELEAETFMSLHHKEQEYKKTCGPAGKIWQVNLSENYGKK